MRSVWLGTLLAFLFFGVAASFEVFTSSISSSSRRAGLVLEVGSQRRWIMRRDSSCSASRTTTALMMLTDHHSNDGDSLLSSLRKRDFKILGIAGGIGSGKSTACQLLLNEIGCLGHIDADKVAHSVYEPGNLARTELVEAFGSDIVNPNDNTIHRPSLGAIVFSDPAKLKQLERIVWPHTQRMVVEQLHQVQNSMASPSTTQNDDDTGASSNSRRPIVIVEAAMMLDADWNDWMDGVWMVTADRDVALPRIVARGGCTLEQAEQRIQAQQSRRGMHNLEDEIEQGVVSAVITNNGGLEELLAQLRDKIDDPTAWYPKPTESIMVAS